MGSELLWGPLRPGLMVPTWVDPERSHFGEDTGSYAASYLCAPSWATPEHLLGQLEGGGLRSSPGMSS